MELLHSGLEKLSEGIYRIRVPYEEVYTTVFLLTSKEGCILFDGAHEQGAKEYVLPVLRGTGMRPSIIVQSHWHDDHANGIPQIAEEFDAVIGLNREEPSNGRYIRLTDGQLLIGRFEVLHLKGHTDDGIALFDRETNALLSADCLQVGGIGKYGVTYTDRTAYIRSVNRIQEKGVDRIITAHDFSPYGFQAQGEKEVAAYLKECIRVAVATENK